MRDLIEDVKNLIVKTSGENRKKLKRILELLEDNVVIGPDKHLFIEKIVQGFDNIVCERINQNGTGICFYLTKINPAKIRLKRNQALRCPFWNSKKPYRKCEYYKKKYES